MTMDELGASLRLDHQLVAVESERRVETTGFAAEMSDARYKAKIGSP